MTQRPHPRVARPRSRRPPIRLASFTAVILLLLAGCGRGPGASTSSPPEAPSPRSGSAMAYDPATHQLILFGGADAVTRDDTWAWDGARWSLLTPAHQPSAREHAALTYDPSSNQLLLFGGDVDDGQSGPRNLNDTWTWDGSDWHELHAPTKPYAAKTPHMAADSVSGRVVLVTQSCYCGGENNETTYTWTWDGRTWARQAAAHRPLGDGAGLDEAPGQASDRPLIAGGGGPLSQSTAMASDPVSGRPVLVERVWYGDAGVPNPTATWTWAGDDWQLSAQHNAPDPPPVTPLLVADSRTRTVLYLDVAMHIWAWDGAAWQPRNDGATPPARSDAAMALDERSGRLVLFGGVGGTPGGLQGDTWTWTTAGGGWTHVAGASAPQAVVRAPATIPPHGISAQEATRRAALRVASTFGTGTPVRTVSGRQRDFWFHGRRPGGDRYVWAVALAGTFDLGTCGGGPQIGSQGPRPTCSPPATSAAVFLDYVTGEWLSDEIPAPPQLLGR